MSLTFNEVIPPEKAKNLSGITLAFLGDAVYTLYVRQKLVKSSDRSAHELQEASADIISAHAQSGLLERISAKFTEDEAAIFRRARNAKKTTRAKSASVAEYNRSTGFEAVLGYLYITGQYDRICALLEE